MAWSWSHTNEAYANAEENLRSMPKEKLEIIFAEWRAAQGKGGIIEDCGNFDERKYTRALAYAKTLDVEWPTRITLWLKETTCPDFSTVGLNRPVSSCN